MPEKDPMNERIARMAKILEHRAEQEQLCQRRAAICRQLVRTAEARLTKLRQERAALRNDTGRQVPTTVHWHQQHQRALADLDRRITRIQSIHQQLAQRASRRQAELVNAAQLQRAAKKVTTRLQQQATQADRRSQQKQLDDLVRTKRIIRNSTSNATVT